LQRGDEGHVNLFANGVEDLFHGMGTGKRFIKRNVFEIGY